MASAKVAITMEESLIEQLDRLVAKRVFLSRSRAIQEAMQEVIDFMAFLQIRHRRQTSDKRP